MGSTSTMRLQLSEVRGLPSGTAFVLKCNACQIRSTLSLAQQYNQLTARDFWCWLIALKLLNSLVLLCGKKPRQPNAPKQQLATSSGKPPSKQKYSVGHSYGATC